MSERPKILVVDDEPAVQQALSRAFALERYLVEVAGDGVAALEALSADRFDTIVLDVADARASRARGLPSAALRPAIAARC